MASARTELSNDLAVIREWLLAATPQARGAIHNREMLANYFLALLTSLWGCEEQIGVRCAENAFLPQGTLSLSRVSSATDVSVL